MFYIMKIGNTIKIGNNNTNKNSFININVLLTT